MAGPVCCFLVPPPGSMLAERGFDAATCQQYATGARQPPANWTVTFVNSPMCTGRFPGATPGSGGVAGVVPPGTIQPVVLPSGPPPPPSPAAPVSYGGIPYPPGTAASQPPIVYGSTQPIAATSPYSLPPAGAVPYTAPSGGTGALSSPSSAGSAGLAPPPSSQQAGQLMLCQPLPAGTQF